MLFTDTWSAAICTSALPESNAKRAATNICSHFLANQATFPGHGVPTEFLAAERKRRALKTHTWGERTTVSVQKAPYELAVVDTMVKALETGTLSIDNANRYGPLIQHLIPRQQFLSGYSKYLKKLGQPEAVCEYYAALRQDLEQSMLRFDDDYQIFQDSFRINRNGTLSYKKTPPQILTARHHFRYGSGKSILLYQHVTANCICLFTQALLCNVSEAIHMLNGIMKHRTGMEPVINICDNAGKAGNERGFYTVETNFFPGRTFEDLEDMNRQAFDWATRRMPNRPVGKSRMIPAAAFEQEKPYLIKLPPYVEPPYQEHERGTDQYGYVSFSGNFYWVPGTRRDDVKVLQYSDHLKIYQRRQLLGQYELPGDAVKNEVIYPDGVPFPVHLRNPSIAKGQRSRKNRCSERQPMKSMRI